MSEPPITPSSLSPTYTCQICRKTFGIQGTPIVGEPAEQKALRTLNMLAAHLQESHKEAIGAATTCAVELSRMLIMSTFRHNDAFLLADSERIRRGLRQASFSPADHISDATIEAQVEAHIMRHEGHEASYGQIRSKAIAVLKDLRDRLEGAPPQKP